MTRSTAAEPWGFDLAGGWDQGHWLSTNQIVFRLVHFFDRLNFCLTFSEIVNIEYNSPAFRVGRHLIRVGDFVVKIGDCLALFMSLDEAVEMLRNDGLSVRLTLERCKEQAFELVLTFHKCFPANLSLAAIKGISGMVWSSTLKSFKS